MKRPRADSDTDAAWEALTEAWDLVDEVQDLYSAMPEDFLWDEIKFQTLIQPTQCPNFESSKEFRYIGRAQAKHLVGRVEGLGKGSLLLVHGAKGSGKSTAASAMAGYLIGVKRMRLAYISAARYIHAPADVLQHALLVATRGNEQVAKLRNLEELIDWCRIHRRDTIVFLVDDWDKFEEFKEGEASLMRAVSYFHALVKLSSTSSRERQIALASDKQPDTCDFDGPYTDKELETWISQSSLPPAALHGLDYFTGGMPRLLRFYAEVHGNRNQFMEKIEAPYTSEMATKLIAEHSTKEELADLLKFVTVGERGAHLKSPLNLTCFYKVGINRLVVLCPYLKAKAESYIMDRQVAFNAQDIEVWASAVRRDCLVRGRNAARLGWNVESLVIAVMRYRGVLWEGLDFALYRTYKHNCEAELLTSLTPDELRKGVLAGPVCFNEKAVDVIYLKLTNGVMTVKAIQITVAKWKVKRRKQSHVVWQEQVLPRWLCENWTVEHQFVYVMPDSVEQGDLWPPPENNVETYIANWRAASAEEASSSNEDDEYEEEQEQLVTEAYDEAANLCNVRSLPVAFKKLRDVDQRLLSRFDELLALQEPSKVVKKFVKECSGQVLHNGVLRPCRRWSRMETDADAYYCCDAHRPRGEHTASSFST